MKIGDKVWLKLDESGPYLVTDTAKRLETVAGWFDGPWLRLYAPDGSVPAALPPGVTSPSAAWARGVFFTTTDPKAPPPPTWADWWQENKYEFSMCAVASAGFACATAALVGFLV